MNQKGRIIIVSGPSGVGKGTVVHQLMEEDPRLQFSVSATTRAKRPNEIDGVHYYFVDHAAFEKMIEDGEMLEYARYADNYYGTPLRPVNEALERGNSVILEIEVQGALQVMARRPDAISIFVAPPSYAELRRRLFGRGDTAPEIAEKRLAIALEECRLASKYQYTVVNDTIPGALAEFRAILAAEACRSQYREIHLKEEE